MAYAQVPGSFDSSARAAEDSRAESNLEVKLFTPRKRAHAALFPFVLMGSDPEQRYVRGRTVIRLRQGVRIFQPLGCSAPVIWFSIQADLPVSRHIPALQQNLDRTRIQY
jgi:hypothetical protein